MQIIIEVKRLFDHNGIQTDHYLVLKEIFNHLAKLA